MCGKLKRAKKSTSRKSPNSRSLKSMPRRWKEPSLSMDGSPFGYAGLEMQEALSTIQTSLEKLEKGGSEPNVSEAPEAPQDDCELA